jgi:hypothetical protein
MISAVGDRGMANYRREWQKSFRPRRVDMLWIWMVFGLVAKIKL